MTPTVLSVNEALFLARCLVVVSRIGLLLLVSFCLLFDVTTAFAQSSVKTRAIKVAVAKVTTEKIADFSELQGRLVAGATESVTAFKSAEIEILGLQIGDFVSKGQQIAKQDQSKLALDRVMLQAN